MSKTAFSSKVRLLATLWMYREPTEESEDWKAFFDSQDLGFPLAHAAFFDHIEIKKSGEKFVESTWELLCEGLGIDKDGEYHDLEDLFGASPNDHVDIQNSEEVDEEE